MKQTSTSRWDPFQRLTDDGDPMPPRRHRRDVGFTKYFAGAEAWILCGGSLAWPWITVTIV